MKKGERVDRVTIYAGDIHNPWKSVYGFSTTAARLAANQALILHCREDEIFDLLAKLNDLLQHPEVLNRAAKLLKKLEQAALEKLVRLIELEEKSLTENSKVRLLEHAEQILADSSQGTVASRLENILAPNKPVQEITGLRTMLARLQVLIPALDKVKDQGFRVVVHDKCRQSAKPALEARRNEPVLLDGKQTTLTAGFLLPVKYHLTLWAYLIVRSDDGQSKVWN